MKMFKGFNDKLQCTPDGKCFQYEVGESYEEPEADLCHTGFHACENPLDVFGYYAPADSRYCEVDLDGVSKKHDDDSKRCGKKITVKAEIGIPGIVKAGVEYIKGRVDWDNAKESNTGDWSAATNTGRQSAASVKGKDSVAIVTGYQGKAKGAIGCWLVLTERNDDMEIVGIQSVKVDGEKIKPDTFCRLENGKVVEVSEDD